MQHVVLPLAVLLTLILTSRAHAWNKPGHKVTGAVAHDLLEREHPEVLPRVLDLLRRHPEYAASFAPKLEALPEPDRDRYLFMLAARWADDVRRGSAYHRGPWHYVNYPLVPPADVGAIPRPSRSRRTRTP